ncbi:MAG: hypothetical protein RMM58_05765 [Chloroflexota bacterium]|nr:hypothetical protein [Dehalococcoidia bacterium]MDW8253368.1 hypothetical protein [Chloroflexota bacterium]
MTRFLEPILVPLIALAILVPGIVGIGLLLLAAGHTGAIVVALAIMTGITAAAFLLDRAPRAQARAEAAGISTPISKYVWRAVLIVTFFAIVGITFYLTFAWITIAYLYPTPGLILIVSGLIGTPALIGLAVAAALLRPRWA